MAKQAMPFPIALMLFLVSGLLLYSIFHAHGWPDADLNRVWRTFPPLLRGAALACFIGNAWGLGAMIDAGVRRARSG